MNDTHNAFQSLSRSRCLSFDRERSFLCFFFLSCSSRSSRWCFSYFYFLCFFSRDRSRSFSFFFFLLGLRDSFALFSLFFSSR